MKNGESHGEINLTVMYLHVNDDNYLINKIVH